MKSLSFFFLMLGVIFITIGYMNNKCLEKTPEKEIEYRFVPRTIYDEQIENINTTINKIVSKETYENNIKDLINININKCISWCNKHNIQVSPAFL